MKALWNPDQYEKFKVERAKPFYDLKRLIEKSKINRALDLGCGTGELTKALFEDLKPRQMIGIDSSPEMVARSGTFGGSNLQFRLADIDQYEPDGLCDLVFSNAALQWVPHHEALFPKILSWVAPGGQLAVQMPVNFDHPSHVLAERIASELFPSIFEGQPPSPTLPLERYAEILDAHGFKFQVARIEVYGHAMKTGLDVLEWTQGTLLNRYRSPLNAEHFEEFLARYKKALLTNLGDGPYFYAFKRALLWGKKNA